ncbi:helix-turn-helix domain-containing protein [Schleiferilactobacillus harbinensis]|jgi:transcriptional regulator with XRE-family HTH domain|uniref:helix-turn-helix domain-containing protein n=1 Tax=Schleiferilactobacillus harbinensis TaxID=304207 RepID=UPI00345EAC4E
MIEFGSTLKKVRLAQGLSQQQVADKLNLTRQTISKWENGRGYPDFENLILLSELYGVTIDQLVNRRTLNLDPVQVLTMNKKREKAMWLTRQAKILVSTIAILLIAYVGITFARSTYDTYTNNIAMMPYFVYVKNVKTVDRTITKEGLITSVDAITLKNGERIVRPTVAKLRKRGLLVKINPWRDDSEQNVQSFSKKMLARNEK